MSSAKINLEVTAEKIIRQAIIDDCWIYCMVTKQWYTPEEFRELADGMMIVNGTKSDLFTNFHVRDPREGLSERTSFVLKVSAELNTFANRVFSYYKLRAASKKPGEL